MFELANASFLKVARRSDVIGKPVRETLPESVSLGFVDLLDEVYRSGKPFVGRGLRHVVRDDAGVASEGYVDFVYQPITDSAGRVIGIFIQGHDVTEASHAHAALREAEERLQLALEAGGMGAWHADLRTGKSEWLGGMATLHGRSADGYAHSVQAYGELVHPADRQSVIDAVNRALQERRDHRIEYRIVWPDGSVRWLEGRGRIYLDEQGEPARMAGVCMDITARKIAEQDLHFLAQASMELAHLVDVPATLDRLAKLAVPTFADWCAVDVLEDDGTLRRLAVAHCDPRKEALAHELHRRYPPAPDAGIGVWNIMRTGAPELVRELSDDVLATAASDAEHLEIVRGLGLRSYIGVPLKIKGQPFGVVSFVSAESGRLYGPADLALAEDLALRTSIAVENARLYQAVQEADRRKDVFLATLSHELRNPLAPIASALALLRVAPHDAGRVDRSVRMMERQVSQLSRLVDDLMDVSRITAGKMEMRRERASLSSILHNALETSRPHIEQARHQLLVNLPGMPMEVDADPVRLAQVFSNLLNNAAKYTPPSGRIELTAAREGNGFLVRVRDNGIGIPREMLRSVFSMFAQERRPSEYSRGGLGIGLSLAEGIVVLHGGRIEAHSEGNGRGSEFHVWLPRAAGADAASEAAPPGTAARQGMRILVVDDNVDAADTVSELLRLLGHEVSVVHSGEEALEAAPGMEPAIVLLDIGLPGIDGYETARRLRALPGLAAARLIALTGWGQDQDKARTAAAGFEQHWVKPVSLALLQAL
ncbi:MAG TPA: ATP-binding protein [Noviherbaspirillum sp.]|nr:ATP-binding protein [Noviherbaspirillum sp.]